MFGIQYPQALLQPWKSLRTFSEQLYAMTQQSQPGNGQPPQVAPGRPATSTATGEPGYVAPVLPASMPRARPIPTSQQFLSQLAHQAPLQPIRQTVTTAAQELTPRAIPAAEAPGLPPASTPASPTPSLAAIPEPATIALPVPADLRRPKFPPSPASPGVQPATAPGLPVIPQVSIPQAPDFGPGPGFSSPGPTTQNSVAAQANESKGKPEPFKEYEAEFTARKKRTREKPKPWHPQDRYWPIEGGGGNVFVGQVISGGGKEYKVNLFDNGPDAGADASGPAGDKNPVTVKIMTLADDEEIPSDTWLFGIFQFTDNDGNLKYFAQPPIWIE